MCTTQIGNFDATTEMSLQHHSTKANTYTGEHFRIQLASKNISKCDDTYFNGLKRQYAGHCIAMSFLCGLWQVYYVGRVVPLTSTLTSTLFCPSLF